MRPRCKKSAGMRHRVTLQRLTEAQDQQGEPIKSWDDVMTVWAEIYPLSGREYFTAQQVGAEVTHRITSRYSREIMQPVDVNDTNILPGGGGYTLSRPVWRIVYGARIFDVESMIDVEERHRYMEYMCCEKVN